MDEGFAKLYRDSIEENEDRDSLVDKAKTMTLENFIQEFYNVSLRRRKKLGASPEVNQIIEEFISLANDYGIRY